jgi:hypothetical protein
MEHGSLFLSCHGPGRSSAAGPLLLVCNIYYIGLTGGLH